MWQLKKFVAHQKQDKQDGRQRGFNNTKYYCFSKELVNSENNGLFAISRTNITHNGASLFINGARFITPLNFPTNHLPDAQDSIQCKMILEKALARHSADLSDSLKYKIRQKFWFSRVSQ